MALDTRNRRASALGVGHTLPAPVFPNPDGTIDMNDWRQINWSYAAEFEAVVPEFVNYTARVLTGNNYVARVV